MSGYVLSLWKGRLRLRLRTLESLAQEVADWHELDASDLRSSTRQRGHVTAARQDFYHRAMAAGWPVERIGAFLGRHHTTVLTGARRHAEREGASA